MKNGEMFFLLTIFLVLISSVSVYAGMQDDFNRADGTLATYPTATNGNNWEGDTSGFVLSNQILVADSGGEVYLKFNKSGIDITNISFDVGNVAGNTWIKWLNYNDAGSTNINIYLFFDSAGNVKDYNSNVYVCSHNLSKFEKFSITLNHAQKTAKLYKDGSFCGNLTYYGLWSGYPDTIVLRTFVSNTEFDNICEGNNCLIVEPTIHNATFYLNDLSNNSINEFSVDIAGYGVYNTTNGVIVTNISLNNSVNLSFTYFGNNILNSSYNNIQFNNTNYYFIGNAELVKYPEINFIKPLNNSNVSRTFDLIVNVTNNVNIKNLTYQINYSDGVLYKQKTYLNVGTEYLINESIDLLFNDHYTIKVIAINDRDYKSEKYINISYYKQFISGKFVVSTESDFNAGTYNNTYYTNNGVTLNVNEDGSYLSKIFDLGSSVSFINMSYYNVYGINLPYNEKSNYGIDMSDNHLYLTFDNSSNLLYDYSGNNKQFTTTGSIVQQDGYLDKSVYYSDTSYSQLNNNVDFNWNWNDKFTIFYFVKTTDKKFIYMSKAYRTGSYAGWVIYDGNAGKICPRLTHDYTANQWIAFCNTKVVNNGVWHLVEITYDGSGDANGYKIYIDNELDTLSIQANTLGNLNSTTTANFQINGRSGDDYLGNFNIDELLIFDRELNESESKRIGEFLLNKLVMKYKTCSDIAMCNLTGFTETNNNGFAEINQNGRYFQFYAYFKKAINDLFLKNVTIYYETLYPSVDFINPIDNGNITKENMSIAIESDCNIDVVKYYIKQNNILYQYNVKYPNQTNYHLNDLIDLIDSGKYNFSVYAHDLCNKSENQTISFFYDENKPIISFSTLNNTQFKSQTIAINGVVTDDYAGVKRTWINDTRFSNLGNDTEFSFVNQVILGEDKNYCVLISSEDNFGNVNNKKICFYIKPAVPITPYLLTSEIEHWYNRKGWIDFYINGYPFIEVGKNIVFGFRIRGADYRKIVFNDVNAYLEFPNNNLTYNLNWNNETLNYEVTLQFDGNDIGKKQFIVYTNDSTISKRIGELYITDFVNVSGTIYSDENKSKKLTKYDQAYIIFIPYYNVKDVENYKSVIFLFDTFNNWFEKILSKIFLTDIKFMSSDNYITYNKKGFVTQLINGQFSIKVPKDLSYQVRLLIFDDNNAVIYNADYYDYIIYKTIRFDTILSEKLLIDGDKELTYIVEDKDLNTGLYYFYMFIIVISILLVISFFIKLWQMTDPATALKSTAVVLSIILIILQIIKFIWW